jgi:hypothetical protein
MTLNMERVSLPEMFPLFTAGLCVVRRTQTLRDHYYTKLFVRYSAGWVPSDTDTERSLRHSIQSTYYTEVSVFLAIFPRNINTFVTS